MRLELCKAIVLVLQLALVFLISSIVSSQIDSPFSARSPSWTWRRTERQSQSQSQRLRQHTSFPPPGNSGTSLSAESTPIPTLTAWEGNVVPYNVSLAVGEKARRLIFEAMQTISGTSCYRFKPRWSSENSYLDFVHGETCQILPSTSRANQNIGVHQIIISINESQPGSYGYCLSHRRTVQLILSALGLPSTRRLSRTGCPY